MKHEFNKEKTSISKLRRAFSVLVVIAILMASISLVYADDNEYSFADENQPVPVGTTFGESNPYVTFLNAGKCVTYLCSSKSDVYCFRNGRYIVTVSATQSDWFHYWWNQENHDNYNNPQHSDASPYDGGTYQDTIQYNSTYNVYYMVHDGLADGGYIPNYAEVEYGLAAFADFIENGGGTPSPSPSPAPVTTELNYTLPAGNVAYIRIDTNTFDGFTLRCTMPINSEMFGTAGTLESKWSTTQHWGFSNSLPSQGDNLSQYGSMISWQVDTSMGTNLFQQSQNAIYNPVGPFLAQDYLVVVNPLYYGVQANNSGNTSQTINNGSIKISVDNAIDIKVFKLTQSVTINNNTATYSTDVSSDPYSGEIDSDTGDIIWTDPSGGSSSPDLGGGNVVNDSNAGFMSWISELVQSVINVFTPAHQAIMTLAQAVQNFASYMYALYVWLPAPILNLLTAAISLAIIIGVVKVFI